LMSQIFSLYIINKAGGLIYQKDYVGQSRLSGNDYLRVASTFHSLHAISGRGLNLAPTQISCPPSTGNPSNLALSNVGITSIDCRDYRLNCVQTLTGIKFLILSSPTSNSHFTDKLLNSIYSLYVDYVLKNPFYEIEMPIRCELFDINVQKAVQNK